MPKKKKTPKTKDGWLFAWTKEPKYALLVCLLAGIAYLLYAQVSNGFYQQDELAHFLSMKGFWKNPNSILSNWAKPGYKLIYAFPALLGASFVKFFNVFIACGIGYFTFLTAKKAELKWPLFAAVILLSQCYWVQLSFRNYSENLTALIYLGVVYFLSDKKWKWAALLLSYGCFLRQETYPIGLLFIGYAVYRKEFIAPLLIFTFPIVQNTWGWLATGKPLYLYDMIAGTSAEYAALYPRQGFEHYFQMSPVIFGYIAMILAIAALFFGLKKKGNLSLPLVYCFVIAGVFAAQHIVFNSKFLDIGPSTGGNLRYFNVIAPLVSVMALYGFERLSSVRKNDWRIISTAVLTIAAIYLTAYDHNNIKLLLNDRHWLVGVPSVIVIGALVLDLNLNIKVSVLLIGLLVQLCVMVDPIRIGIEDAKARDIALELNKLSQKNEISVASSHATARYFLSSQFESTPMKIDSILKMSKGDYVLWDSHYSKRAGVDQKDLISDTTNFKFLKQEITNDKRFGVLIFKKK